nr:hydrogen gas-evolving membrane-bound hydrogenase subunit E [Amycolatopsis arida]
MLIAIAAHFAMALVVPLLARRWGRAAFLVGAVVPAATLVLALVMAVPHLPHGALTESLGWAPAIGLELVVRLDALALLMVVLVSGVGAVVLAYFASYAHPGEPGIGRNAAVLLVFAGAMLGLVLADNVFALYVCWELTTVCSFLLIGEDGERRAARRAATQALLVTAAGGLAMLLGLILLGTAAGTFRISALLADPPRGGVVPVALLLVLLGAFTKSAQIPFHPWLPVVMVAPTPVSAYLHAAAMVKAGVYLVARLAPGFADLAVWWVPVVVVGLGSMLLGGYRALREHDLKRLLAFGTVSQLGFLTVLAGAGGHVTAVAAAAMVLAHGLFKSALFLTVGVIDERAGTRDLRELSGLGRRWPVLAGGAALAGASMAGLPPLLGFVGKEAAFEAFSSGAVVDVLVLAGLAVGSVLTVGYTLRFLVGAFGTRAGSEPVRASRPGVGFTGPVLLPAVAGLGLGLAPGLVEPLAAGYAAAYPTDHPYHLALWHGWTPTLLLSAAVLVLGALLYRAGRAVVAVPPLSPVRAQQGYRGAVRGLEWLARAVTARTQVGSLPVYLGVILSAVVLVPGAGLLVGAVWPDGVRVWDTPLQLPLALLVALAALTVVRARQRLTAVLLTGLVGFGIGGLFLIYGAPDLALAQFLVESLTLVVFVLVLRRFPRTFGRGRAAGDRVPVKPLIAGAGGVLMALMAVLFSGSRREPPVASEEYVARAGEEAGASNVVNAILVDFRALDTIGEITVLAVAATGAASLALLLHRAHRPGPTDDEQHPAGEEDRAEVPTRERRR